MKIRNQFYSTLEYQSISQRPASVRKSCMLKSFISKTRKLEKRLSGTCMRTRIPRAILVHDLLAIEVEISISETENCIELRFQCQINHGT